jgi:hypothetical protein
MDHLVLWQYYQLDIYLKITTTPQQQHPPVLMRQQEVEGCNHYEEEGEVE